MAEFRLEQGSDGVFYAAGELDLLSADDLEERIARDPVAAHDLIVDLTNLTFIDSTGIRAFLRVARQIAPRCLVLRRPQPHVAKVLDIIRVQSFGIRVEAIGFE